MKPRGRTASIRWTWTWTEERLPDGWELRIRDQMGLAMTTFNRTVYGIELGIKEEVNQPLNLL